MATDTTHGVRLAKTSPAYLHANSTSHTWIFSAIAEIIDNAYDAKAKSLHIYREAINGSEECLVFMDDGQGMSADELFQMLSFGYCEKDKQSVGRYGNGFKSGSMRLGEDALVLTANEATCNVGLLSQTYLRAVESDTVLVPIISIDRKSNKLVNQRDDVRGSVKAITTYSLFSSLDQLDEQFSALRGIGNTGTMIIIYNLHRMGEIKLELDFNSNPTDILNSKHQMADELNIRRLLPGGPVPLYQKSLREYCSILFLRPKMKIILRGQKVKTKLITKSLRSTEKDVYRPNWLMKPVQITLGFNQNTDEYGIMMYHNNRLIKAYMKVGYQKQNNEKGVGVVGVVSVDFLTPIHNKQDFLKTDQYNTFVNAVGVKLNDYWHTKVGEETDPEATIRKMPDWTWAQCDNCLKWRRLPDCPNPDVLPDKWYCYQNNDPVHNRCDIDEEPEDEDELIWQASYQKRKRPINTKYKTKEEELRNKEEDLAAKEQIINSRYKEKEEELRNKEEHLAAKERIINSKANSVEDDEDEEEEEEVSSKRKSPYCALLPESARKHAMGQKLKETMPFKKQFHNGNSTDEEEEEDDDDMTILKVDRCNKRRLSEDIFEPDVDEINTNEAQETGAKRMKPTLIKEDVMEIASTLDYHIAEHEVVPGLVPEPEKEVAWAAFKKGRGRNKWANPTSTQAASMSPLSMLLPIMANKPNPMAVPDVAAMVSMSQAEHTPSTSSAANPTKSDSAAPTMTRDILLAQELEETKRTLMFLRQNVLRLLEIMVPDQPLCGIEMVDAVVAEILIKKELQDDEPLHVKKELQYDDVALHVKEEVQDDGEPVQVKKELQNDDKA